MNTKRCTVCKLDKSCDEFSWSNKAKGIKQRVCKVCNKSYSAKRCQRDSYKARKREQQYALRTRNKQYVADYLKGKKCVDCPEQRAYCLQFDHKDESQKSMNISDMCSTCHSIDNIQMEIDKCEVRCANCHSIRTAIRQGWYQGIDTSGLLLFSNSPQVDKLFKNVFGILSGNDASKNSIAEFTLQMKMMFEEAVRNGINLSDGFMAVRRSADADIEFGPYVDIRKHFHS